MSAADERLWARYHELRWNWYGLMDNEPDRAIAMIEEAIEIAQTLEEPYAEMEARHWLAQAFVFRKRDYDRALPLVVASAVEGRKPIYGEWQTRICLYQDLIAAHVGNDPVGHAETIEAALDRMQAEATPSSQCAHCLQGERTAFELRRHNLDDARQAAVKYLSEARTSHHRSLAHNRLAAIAFRQEKWPSLLDHAEAAQKAGERTERAQIVVYALMWQAVAQLQLGNSREAALCFEQSEAQRALSGSTLEPEYWDARVAYHALTGDHDGALAARRAHLESIAGHGALREEAEALLDLCRLQKQQGKLTEKTIEKTREAIARLKVPGDLPNELQRLLE